MKYIKQFLQYLSQFKQAFVSSLLIGIFVCIYSHFMINNVVSDSEQHKQEIIKLLNESIELNYKLFQYNNHLQAKDSINCPCDTIIKKKYDVNHTVDSILANYHTKYHR